MKYRRPYFPPYGDAVGELLLRTAVRRCNAVGHNMADRSHGGPESGSMAAECVRCGYSFNVTLY